MEEMVETKKENKNNTTGYVVKMTPELAPMIDFLKFKYKLTNKSDAVMKALELFWETDEGKSIKESIILIKGNPGDRE